MAKITQSFGVEIDAPVERVYAFFENPENMPEVWPSLMSVSNVQQKADGGHSFDWTYKMAGIPIEGHTDTIEVERNKRFVTQSERGITNKYVYTFEPIDGRTRLRVDAEYEIPGRVLGKLAEPLLRRMNEHEGELVMRNVKARLEMGEKVEKPKPAEAAPPAE